MTIERTKDEVIFRIPSSVKIDDLQELFNHIKFKEISGKTKVKQTVVDDLVKSVKKGRWANTKKKLGL